MEIGQKKTSDFTPSAGQNVLVQHSDSEAVVLK